VALTPRKLMRSWPIAERSKNCNTKSCRKQDTPLLWEYRVCINPETAVSLCASVAPTAE
jgi:hypothetical protein